jgi:chemotaxis protein CheD
MSQMKVSKDPNLTLTIPNIVSGLGIAMYDSSKKVGGIVHSILPRCRTSSDSNPLKYVDSSITLLVQELEKNGAVRSQIHIKLVGGAKILSAAGMPMGEKNIEAAKGAITREKLSVKGLDIGGNVKRTLTLNLANGEVVVERFNEGTKII